MTNTSKPSYNLSLLTGRPITTAEPSSPIGNYYRMSGENSKNPTASRHSNKPSLQRSLHRSPQSHNTPPTSLRPSARTIRYGNTPSETPTKTKSYSTLYSTLSPSSTYTTTTTSQPSSSTTIHTTTMTPSTSDHLMRSTRYTTHSASGTRD